MAEPEVYRARGNAPSTAFVAPCRGKFAPHKWGAKKAYKLTLIRLNCYLHFK